METRAKYLIQKCLDVLNKVDGCSDEHDLAIFSLSQFVHGKIDQLRSFLDGPVYDGDVISKQGRDELINMGLVVKCCFKGECGYQIATYRGWAVFQHVKALIKEGGDTPAG